MKDVLRIYIGFLPSTEPGGITNPARPTIIDHSRHGGPEGLYSVSGVKFTTSHAVAEKTLNRIRRPKIGSKRPAVPPSIPTMIGNFEFNWMPAPDDKQWKNTLTRLIEEESVVHLDDLVLRRTNLGDNPHRALKLAPEVCSLFPWDKSRCAKELNRLEQALSIERRLL